MKTLLITAMTLIVLVMTATASVDTTEQIINDLMLCDHNQDGNVDITDAGIFAKCRYYFDANEDGRHDLTDIGLYAANYHDTNWCAEHLSECVEEDVEEVPEFGVLAALGILAVAGLFIARRRN